ncbi:hypothetical protein K1719_025798 [Acacia pycnantha]|nr:hypothetical protein K1719_025798 [Acacia pycnantha]
MEAKVRLKCGFDHELYVDPCGLAGGLAVWWLGCISLTVLYKSKNVVHVLLESGGLCVPKIVTFVYGPPKEGERRVVWDVLRRLSVGIAMSWLSSWSDLAGYTDDRILELIRRLEICRGRLVEWSKREFPNFRKVIDHLRGRLHSCYEGIFSAGKLQEAENLLGLLEETWIREETYWWQRSRISWLKSGDQNTKFFHSSVIQRRQRNKILRLRSDDGRWLEDRREIHQSFSRFYKGLFSSGGARSMEQALSYVQKVVTDEDNLILMSSG